MYKYNSKQRHGWPKKNEGIRAYRERNGSYFITFPEERERNGDYQAVINVSENKSPRLGTTTLSPEWMMNAGITRVQWSEIPKEWQDKLRHHFIGQPEEHRGLWLVKNQPALAQV